MENFCKNYAFMFGFDLFFSLFVVTNLVVFVWRIVWDMQDLYLNGSNIVLNCFVSILIYIVLIAIVKWIQYDTIKLKMIDEAANRELHKSGKNKNNSLVYKIKTKLFILVFAFANVNHWRGVWYLTSHYTEDSTEGLVTVGAISFLCLVAMKRVCVLISAPFWVNKDSKQAAYQLHPNSFNKNTYLNLEDNLNVSSIFNNFL
jgi:hypothetical protein